MARPVVFAPHSWGLSHVGRSLLVATELAKRGHHCIFVGDGPYVLAADSLVGRSGIAVWPLIDATMDQVLVNGFDFHSADSLRRFVDAEREAIARIRPALIVSDYRPSIHIAAAIERVPVVALTNTHWTHYWGTAITPPIDHPVTLLATRLFGERLGMALMTPLAPRIARQIFRRNVGIYNALLARHHLPVYEDILRLFEGSQMTCLTDAPEWCETVSPLPPSVHSVGPLYWSSAQGDGWDQDIPEDLPWIYVSGGSTVNPDVFPALFREMADLPYRILLSTAGCPLPRGVPENFVVREFLPGAAVMRRSRLSVLNGGSGTIYQAIAARTPFILVAMRGDQEWNGRDAERLGIGRLLYRRHVTARPGLLREAMLDTLARSGLGANRRNDLAERIERYRAANTVADLLEGLLGGVPREECAN